MRLFFFSAIWVLIAGSAFGAERNAVVRLQELVLPEFVLERATLKEGLAEVEAAWVKEFPGESFPVVVVERLDYRQGGEPVATIKLRQVPALSAVTYLAELHRMSVRHGLDMVILRPMSWLDENAWIWVRLRLYERSIRALGLSTEADGDDDSNRALKETLSKYGISFEPSFDIRWLGDSKRLFVRNTPEEIFKLEALLILFDAGYSLRKSAENRAGGEDSNEQAALTPGPEEEGDQKTQPKSAGLSQIAASTAGSDRNAIVRFYELVVPELVLDEATLPEALAELEAAWVKKHPGESFPIAAIEEDENYFFARTSTLRLKKVPAIEALRYITELHGMTIRPGLDLVMLHQFGARHWEQPDSVSVALSDSIIRALKLSTEADGDEEANRALKETLANYGFYLFEDDYLVPHWDGARKVLSARGEPVGISRLKGLLMLIEAGYSVVEGDDQ